MASFLCHVARDGQVRGQNVHLAPEQHRRVAVPSAVGGLRAEVTLLQVNRYSAWGSSSWFNKVFCPHLFRRDVHGEVQLGREVLQHVGENPAKGAVLVSKSPSLMQKIKVENTMHHRLSPSSLSLSLSKWNFLPSRSSSEYTRLGRWRPSNRISAPKWI